jgi:hypothetical protein
VLRKWLPLRIESTLQQLLPMANANYAVGCIIYNQECDKCFGFTTCAADNCPSSTLACSASTSAPAVTIDCASAATPPQFCLAVPDLNLQLLLHTAHRRPDDVQGVDLLSADHPVSRLQLRFARARRRLCLHISAQRH